MRKEFNKAHIEVIRVGKTDVIATSGDNAEMQSNSAGEIQNAIIGTDGADPVF